MNAKEAQMHDFSVNDRVLCERCTKQFQGKGLDMVQRFLVFPLVAWFVWLLAMIIFESTSINIYISLGMFALLLGFFLGWTAKKA